MREWDKNPHIDHVDNMRQQGWRINRHGEWSMNADLWISKRERERVLKIFEQDKLSAIPADPNPELQLFDALGQCLEIDREARRGKA